MQSFGIMMAAYFLMLVALGAGLGSAISGALFIAGGVLLFLFLLVVVLIVIGVSVDCSYS